MEVDYVAHYSADSSNSFTRCNNSVPVNTTPTFTSSPVRDATAGVEYSYLLTINDANNDNLQITATDIPNWLSYDSVARELTGTSSSNDVGLHAVVMTLTDGNENVTQNFVIKVIDGNENTNSNTSGGGSMNTIFLFLLSSLIVRRKYLFN